MGRLETAPRAARSREETPWTQCRCRQRGLTELRGGELFSGRCDRRAPVPGPRDAQLDDLTDHGAELLEQWALVVGDAVALADLLHLGSDLGVAARRHVREEVVLDLMR